MTRLDELLYLALDNEFPEIKSGAELPISANDISETSTKQFIDGDLKSQITANQGDIQGFGQRISDVENIINGLTTTDEKVKMDANDASGYLADKLDGTTLESLGGKVIAKSLDGMTVTVNELNHLLGLTGNVQLQIDSLSNITSISQVVNTELDLPTDVGTAGTTILVREDSTQNGSTTFYTSDGNTWQYVSQVDSGIARDFTVNPIDLTTESTNVLPKTRYEKQNSAETPFTDSSGNIQASNAEEAIKEVFTYSDSIRKQWANTIGSPLSTNDKLEDQLQKYEGIFENLINAITYKGVPAYDYNKLSELPNKIVSIPNVSVGIGVKKKILLNVTAPRVENIVLSEEFKLEDINTTLFEIVGGQGNVLHYNLDFNNADVSNFLSNEDATFDGTMKLRTDYTFDMTKYNAWNESGSVHIRELTEEDWNSFDKLNITSNGDIQWKDASSDSGMSIVNPVFRSSGTLTQSISGSAGFSTNQGRAIGEGVFYYEIKKNSGSTANNRTGLVNTISNFNYGSASYFSKNGTNIPSGTNIGILLDLRSHTGGRAKHTRDGTTWTDWTPITGATGTTLLGTLYIALNNSASSTTATYSLNVGGQAFQYEIPQEYASELGLIYSFNGRKVYDANNKIFILNNGEYKKYDSAWVSVATTMPNVSEFMNQGMNSISPLLDRANGTSPMDDLLGDITILTWSDEIDSTRVLELIGTKNNPNDVVYPTGDISLLGVNNIESVNITATGNGRMTISVDSGVTWNTYNGNSWVVVDDFSQAMTYSEFNALTGQQLEELKGESNTIRFAYYLTYDSLVDRIELRISMQGTPQIANKNDYNWNYDTVTKTITYEITKNGSYIINYGDA